MRDRLPALDFGAWGSARPRLLRAFDPRVLRAPLRREVGVPRPEAREQTPAPSWGVGVGGGGGREGWGGSHASLERVYQGLGAKAASSDSFLPCKGLLLVG